MVHHHKMDCLVKRLDCSVMVQVKVTGKVQNSSECLSGRYLLSCWTFCNQTWSGDATSWAKVSCKKIDLLSSSSGSQWGLIWSNMTVSTISAELLIFLQPNLIGWPNRHLLNHSTPQWGAADAEIEVPSGENSELKRSPLKAWSRYIAIYATLTARDFFFAYFYPSCQFTCIFSKTSPECFPVLVWLTPVAV